LSIFFLFLFWWSFNISQNKSGKNSLYLTLIKNESVYPLIRNECVEPLIKTKYFCFAGVFIYLKIKMEKIFDVNTLIDIFNC